MSRLVLTVRKVVVVNMKKKTEMTRASGRQNETSDKQDYDFFCLDISTGKSSDCNEHKCVQMRLKDLKRWDWCAGQRRPESTPASDPCYCASQEKAMKFFWVQQAQAVYLSTLLEDVYNMHSTRTLGSVVERDRNSSMLNLTRTYAKFYNVVIHTLPPKKQYVPPNCSILLLWWKRNDSHDLKVCKVIKIVTNLVRDWKEN